MYNNYFNPYGYQQQPLQDNLTQLRNAYLPQSQPQNTDERIWVQGEDAAKAYLVTANGFVRLWDSTSPVFYEKRADQSGRPYMETFEYKRRGSESPNVATVSNNATTELEERIKALEDKFKEYEKATKEEE